MTQHEDNKTTDSLAVDSASTGSEWLGTCEECGNKRGIGFGGQARMGRKHVYVGLRCENCGWRTSHKFKIQNVESNQSDK